jgi:catechol 2,3-dioxygenase-like lactoylglutathione lyase family enzyme
VALSPAIAGVRVARLRHLRLCSVQAMALAAFYESALGFRRVAVEHLSGARTQDRLGVTGRTLRVTLELGAQKIKLLQFVDQPGREYPAGSDASDLVFQHFAIVVADMGAAVEQLSRTSGWRAITEGGPQQLPASSGGVTAFKFRDPDGHPLELLAFPSGSVPAQWRQQRAGSPFLGIDHSAISVGDSERSAAFYESLGLKLSGQTLNDGPAQARLDGLARPVAEVTAMEPAHSTPHVELLCYRKTRQGGVPALRVNDVAATCLVFDADGHSLHAEPWGGPVQERIDPDGHHLAIVWPRH